MATESTVKKGLSFRVLDAMDAPHRGRILRLRLQSGEAPTIRALKGRRFRAEGPEGQVCQFRVTGFAVFGGKPSSDRLARTGRVDVHVEEEGPDGPIGLTWEVAPV